MAIKSISNDPSFAGKVIVKNKISSTQNYLFNLHRPALEEKIKDMPFDLFVEQSKSKKTIAISTSVKDSYSYFVRKNKQNFEEIADFAVSDAKKKSEIYQKTLKVNQMFDCQKSTMMNVLTGNFKEARESEKQLAKLAVNDFETYKLLPHVRFTNLPFEMGKQALKQSLKYRIYRAFSPKTPEEKQFQQMKKDYLKELKSKNEKPKVVDIKFPGYYV